MADPPRPPGLVDAIAGLWRELGRDPAALDRVSFTGADPVLPSVFACGTAAAATTAAANLAMAELRSLADGRPRQVRADVDQAALVFRSERYVHVEPHPPAPIWDPIAGFYRTGDDGWVQLHTNYPHHRDGVVALLGAANDRTSVEAAVRTWRASDLEDALAAAGLCATMLRTREEWIASPHGQAVAALPTLELIRIGDAPPEPVDRLRVLDLTRVIAGPVCGRFLAAHGADVLRIGAAHLPTIEALVVDTGFGKRSAFLDLRDGSDADQLRVLARDTDVFVQGYRPGAIARHGFAPEDLAALRPGIVYASLSAFGHTGPWAARRGFDSLTQTASGIAHEGGASFGLDAPRHLPCQALDHGAGYLLASARLTALHRRATEGGSWLVQTSLAQVGRWLDGLGRVAGTDLSDPTVADVADRLWRTPSPFGTVVHAPPPGEIVGEPAHWRRPPSPVGSHSATWA